MHIKINLTEDIINQCLELHYGDQPVGKKSKQRLLWIPLILFAIAAYLIYDELKQPAPGQNLVMAILYIGFGISYYVFMRKRLVQAGRRLLKSMGTNASFTMNITGDEVITTTTNGTFSTRWSAFTGALISKGNVLLYQSNDTFTMLNHTFFKEGDFEVFKQVVREKVSPLVEV